METKRTFKETQFWVWVGCILISIVLDYFNMSFSELKEVVEGAIQRTYKNSYSIMMWIFPVVLTVKKMIEDWRKSGIERDIEIAKLEKSTSPP